MSQTFSLLAPSSINSGALAEDRQKIPHIHLRAQLGSIHRQYKPLETYDTESGVDDVGGVASSFVQQVVSHLEEEEEEELKALLKDTYAMDEDSVSKHNTQRPNFYFPILKAHSA
jgi:hemerythrin-like domain-containing protein